MQRPLRSLWGGVAPLGSRLFTARMPPTAPTHSLTQLANIFLLHSLERMCSSTLRESLSHSRGGDAHLIVRQWQTAWLTAAITAIPPDTRISQDVGAIYGAPGYLDFFIDGNLGPRMGRGTHERRKKIGRARWAFCTGWTIQQYSVIKLTVTQCP